jgi:hypothetical protein
MAPEQSASAEKLRAEIASLRQAIDALAALPDMQRPLQEQLAAKERALAALTTTGGSTGRTHSQQIGEHAQVGTAIAGDVHGDVSSVQQSGGVNFGSGNTIEQIGDIVAGDKTVNEGPKVYGNITSGRDVNIATNQTINNAVDNTGAQGVFHAPVTINYGSSQPAASVRELTVDEQIAQQQQRLMALRGQLADLLLQEAKFGSAYAPSYVTSGMREARANIQRTKQTLRDLGATVNDHPDDTSR